MGNLSCCLINTGKNKSGQLYDEIKNQIRPFDLIFFKNGCLISSFEIIENPCARGIPFTHVGIVVTREILDLHILEENQLYIFESILNEKYCGKINSIPDVNGNMFSGAQLRNLTSVINVSDSPNNTVVAWCPLILNPIDSIGIDSAKILFMATFNELIGKMYDANCYSLLSALYPCMRPYRQFIEKLTCTSDWLFCSELVTIVLQRLNVIPKTIDPKNMVPVDLTYPEEHNVQMPNIIREIILITTRAHYKKKYRHCTRNNTQKRIK